MDLIILQFDNLLREIHQAPLFKEPIVGNNPFESVQDKPPESVTDKWLLLLKDLIESYNQGISIFSYSDLIGKLDCSRIIAEVYIEKLILDGFIEENKGPFDPTGFCLTIKAKCYAIKQGWGIK